MKCWEDGKTLILTRENNWTPQCTYTVTIPAGAVKNSSGDSLTNEYVFSFTAAKEDSTPQETQSIIRPVNGATLDYSELNITWNKTSWVQKYKVTVEDIEKSKYVFTKELPAASTLVKVSKVSFENWHQYKIWLAGIDKNGVQQSLGRLCEIGN